MSYNKVTKHRVFENRFYAREGQTFERKFAIKASDEVTEIFLYDSIVSEGERELYGSGVTPRQFIDELAKHSGPVRLRIDSPGGDVFAGFNILNHIRERGNVEVVIDGAAASAAAAIAVSGQSLKMHSHSFLMMHQASTVTVGNANDLSQTIALLRKIDNELIRIFHAKAERYVSEAELEKMIVEETWLNAEEAKAMGFADTIIAPAGERGGMSLDDIAALKDIELKAAIAQLEPLAR